MNVWEAVTTGIVGTVAVEVGIIKFLIMYIGNHPELMGVALRRVMRARAKNGANAARTDKSSQDSRLS